jgi:hypothetical protein
VVALFTLGAAPTNAQWQTSLRPSLGQSTANTGVLFGARLEAWQPGFVGSAFRDAALLTIEGAVGFTGSWLGGTRFDAPGLWNGWRLTAVVEARRDAEFEYFGLGNETVFDRALITDRDPDFFRVRRNRYAGCVELTRRLVGPLSLATRVGLVKAEFDPVGGNSVFLGDFGNAIDQTDFQAGASLVFDTRDSEFTPRNGFLVETGVLGGIGSEGYVRVTAVGRGYAALTPKTVGAIRVGGSGIFGTPTLDARFVLPTWGDEIAILGGRESFRGLRNQRLAGEHVLFLNAEVRQDLFQFLGRSIGVIGFVDAGRVFEDEAFRLTLDDFEVGAGGGASIRMGRSLFTFSISAGPDGALYTSNIGSAF